MRHLLTLLAALCLLAAPAAAQTMKALMFNSTNGQVVANTGTNVLVFTNPIKVGSIQFPSAGGTVSYEGVNFLDLEDPGLFGVWSVYNQLYFVNPAPTRTNLGLGLPALTNTSNTTAMRALGGSTNTNEPYSGTVALTNTNVLTFSNGVLLKIQ